MASGIIGRSSTDKKRNLVHVELEIKSSNALVCPFCQVLTMNATLKFGLLYCGLCQRVYRPGGDPDADALDADAIDTSGASG